MEEPAPPFFFVLSDFNSQIKLSNLIKIKTLLSNRSILVLDRQLSSFNKKIYSCVIKHACCLLGVPARKERNSLTPRYNIPASRDFCHVELTLEWIPNMESETTIQNIKSKGTWMKKIFFLAKGAGVIFSVFIIYMKYLPLPLVCSINSYPEFSICYCDDTAF